MKRFIVLLVIAAGVPAAAETPRDPIAWPDSILELQNRPGGITADEAARRAAEKSPSVAASARHWEAAEQRVAAARGDFLPTLTFELRAVRLSDLGEQSLGSAVVAPNQPLGPLPASGVTLINAENNIPSLKRQYTAEASLTVPLSDYALRLAQSYAAADKRSTAAHWLFLAEKANRGIEARLAFYEWAAASAQTLGAEQFENEATRRLIDIENRIGSGQASDEALLQARAVVARAAYTLAVARTTVNVLGERLRTLIRENGAERLEIGESLTEFPAEWEPGAYEDLLEEAFANRWELRSLAAEADAGDKDADAVKSGLWPRVIGFAGALEGNPNPRYVIQQDTFDLTWEVGVAMVWSPNALWTTANDVAMLRASSEELRYRRLALMSAIRMELSEALAEWRNAKLGLNPALGLLRASEAAYQARQKARAAGKATSAAMRQAEALLTQARLDVLTALLRIKMARAKLEHRLARSDIPR